MKKNDVFVTRIRDISDEGAGIGSFEGMTFFIPGALPDDEIEAGITKLKKSYGYARLIRVISPSADRIEPVCPISDKCGGCTMMSLSYEAELRYKTGKVKDALVRIGGFETGFIDEITEPIIGMDEPCRYRNKAQYPVQRDNNGNIAIGFYASRSHRVIPCEDCLIGQESDRRIIGIIRKWMEDHSIEPYDETTGKGELRHILIRTGRGPANSEIGDSDSRQIMVCLIVNGSSISFCEEITKRLAAEPDVCSVVLNENTRRDNVILGNRTKCLYGNPYIEDHIGDVTFRIQARSFYQVNPVQMEKLYGVVAKYADLKGSECVWDIYCGIGTIGLTLAKNAGEVCGVEIIPDAVEDARVNARANGIKNASYTLGAAEDVLPDAEPDLVIVDPPRKGCDERCLKAILSAAPPRIIYVSCNPATLARDLKILCADSYSLLSVTPVDQFSRSGHVETVCLLTRK